MIPITISSDYYTFYVANKQPLTSVPFSDIIYSLLIIYLYICCFLISCIFTFLSLIGFWHYCALCRDIAREFSFGHATPFGICVHICLSMQVAASYSSLMSTEESLLQELNAACTSVLSNGRAAVKWKLLYHWLKGLRQRYAALTRLPLTRCRKTTGDNLKWTFRTKNWLLSYFFIDFCSLGCDWAKVIVDLDNSLAPKRRQATK